MMKRDSGVKLIGRYFGAIPTQPLPSLAVHLQLQQQRGAGNESSQTAFLCPAVICDLWCSINTSSMYLTTSLSTYKSRGQYKMEPPDGAVCIVTNLCYKYMFLVLNLFVYNVYVYYTYQNLLHLRKLNQRFKTSLRFKLSILFEGHAKRQQSVRKMSHAIL